MRRSLSVASIIAVLSVCSCQPALLASSESPDRNYRCEVYWGKPHLLWGMKFRYYFNIKSRKTYSSLEGHQFEYDTDLELQESDFRFEWSGHELKVSLFSGGAPLAQLTGAFDAREQVWRKTG